MEGAVAAEVMDDRLQRLQARIAEHSLAFNRATIGRDTQILIDRKGRLPGQMIGKSPWLQSVFVETDAAIGDMLDVTVTSALPNSLGGVAPHREGRLMAKRELAAANIDAKIEGRARLELEFEQPYLLGPLFGDYDRHLVMIEDRLGVNIAARGNRVHDRGRARRRRPRPRRAGRALQPARPGPGRRCRRGRGGDRHGQPAGARRDHRRRGRLAAAR